MGEKEKRTPRDFDQLLAEHADKHAVYWGLFVFLGVFVYLLTYVLYRVAPHEWGKMVLLGVLELLGFAFLARLDSTLEALPPGVREEQKAAWTRLFHRVLALGGGATLCALCLALLQFGYGAIVMLGALALVVAFLLSLRSQRSQGGSARDAAVQAGI